MFVDGLTQSFHMAPPAMQASGVSVYSSLSHFEKHDVLLFTRHNFMAFYPKQNIIPFIQQKKTHTKFNSKLRFDSIRTVFSWGKMEARK